MSIISKANKAGVIRPPLFVWESAGSREEVPPRKNCPHLPPGGPQSGTGIAVMTTPTPASPAPPRATFLKKVIRPTLGLRKRAPFGFSSAKIGTTSLSQSRVFRALMQFLEEDFFFAQAPFEYLP